MEESDDIDHLLANIDFNLFNISISPHAFDFTTQNSVAKKKTYRRDRTCEPAPTVFLIENHDRRSTFELF